MRSISTLLLLAFFVLIAAPFVSTAALPDQIVPCNGLDCNVCHLATLAQNLLNVGIFTAVFISAILFAYAGWLYLTDAALGGQQRAKSMFFNVVAGLVIILAAWLIVDTMMKVMLDGRFLPWNSVCG